MTVVEDSSNKGTPQNPPCPPAHLAQPLQPRGHSQRLRAHDADPPGAAAASGAVGVHAQAVAQHLRQQDREGLQGHVPMVLEGGEG